MAPLALPLGSPQSLSKDLLESTFRGWQLHSSTTRSPFARAVKYTSIDTGEDSTLPDYPPLDLKPWEYCDFSYLGFDPLSNKHNVLVQTVKVVKRLFWVFTRGSGSWSRIEPLVPEEKISFPSEHENAIHLISDPANPADSDTSGLPVKFILAFDMGEDQLRKIPLPDDPFPRKLTQSGGCLILVKWYFNMLYQNPQNTPTRDDAKIVNFFRSVGL